MELNGQFNFEGDVHTILVPCPKCGAAANEPCVQVCGKPWPRGVVHCARVAEVLSEPSSGRLRVPCSR